MPAAMILIIVTMIFTMTMVIATVPLVVVTRLRLFDFFISIL
jgi:hypothetical protein